MRNQKVDSENVDQKLFEIFSELGYDGATMELLAQATGLKKASLYHRFPKGKREMAEHVLTMVEQWIKENVVAVLADQKVNRELRLKKALEAIDYLYNGGSNNCLFRTLTIGVDTQLFKDRTQDCINLLMRGFSGIAIECGLSSLEAKQKTRQVSVLIQGALVMVGITGDKSYFKESLSEISTLLQSNSDSEVIA